MDLNDDVVHFYESIVNHAKFVNNHFFWNRNRYDWISTKTLWLRFDGLFPLYWYAFPLLDMPYFINNSVYRIPKLEEWMNEIKIFGNDIICVLRATILGGGEKRFNFFCLKINFLWFFYWVVYRLLNKMPTNNCA